MENEFYIVPALYDRDTYFLFRDYGNEIKFTILEGKINILGKGFFVPSELIFIKQNFL
jgi:hypothetical protein